MSCCLPKVPGSIPLSRNGCMRRSILSNPMDCSRQSSWLNVFVLILAAPMNHILPLSKRLRDYAIGCYSPWDRSRFKHTDLLDELPFHTWFDAIMSNGSVHVRLLSFISFCLVCATN